MKNKPQMVNQNSRHGNMDWLYEEAGEDDFLMGKTPMDLSESLEDE